MAFMLNCNIKSTFDCPDNIREDVLDIMVNLSPVKTPFLSTLRKTVARAVLHEWQVDSLSRPSDPDNPVVRCTRESSDFDFEELDCPCRIGNQVHILRRTGDVSWLQRAVDTIAIEDEFAYQTDRQMTKLALDTEFAIIHSPNADNTAQLQPQEGSTCGSPNGCREMDGLLRAAAWTTADFACLDDMKQGTVLDFTGSPCTDLSPFILDNLSQIMFHKGAEPRNIWVNTTLKRLISSFFLSGQEKIIAVAEKKLINVVDVYESDFGLRAINVHLDIPTDTVLMTDEEFLALAFAYPTRVEQLAKVSNSDKFGIEHALTLEVRAPAALGVIRGLCVDNILFCDPCTVSGAPKEAPAKNLPR